MWRYFQICLFREEKLKSSFVYSHCECVCHFLPFFMLILRLKSFMLPNSGAYGMWHLSASFCSFGLLDPFLQWNMQLVVVVVVVVVVVELQLELVVVLVDVDSTWVGRKKKFAQTDREGDTYSSRWEGVEKRLVLSQMEVLTMRKAVVPQEKFFTSLGALYSVATCFICWNRDKGDVYVLEVKEWER